MLVDLMMVDICSMATGKLADRVAGCAAIISMRACSDRVRCGNILVQHYSMRVAHDAIVHIAADDDAAGTD